MAATSKAAGSGLCTGSAVRGFVGMAALAILGKPNPFRLCDTCLTALMLLRATVPTTIAGCVALLASLDELARDADARDLWSPAYEDSAS